MVKKTKKASNHGQIMYRFQRHFNEAVANDSKLICYTMDTEEGGSGA